MDLPLYNFFKESFHNDFPNVHFGLEMYAVYVVLSFLIVSPYFFLILIAARKILALVNKSTPISFICAVIYLWGINKGKHWPNYYE